MPVVVGGGRIQGVSGVLAVMLCLSLVGFGILVLRACHTHQGPKNRFVAKVIQLSRKHRTVSCQSQAVSTNIPRPNTVTVHCNPHTLDTCNHHKTISPSTQSLNYNVEYWVAIDAAAVTVRSNDENNTHHSTPEARSPEEYILLAALLHVFVALKRTWDISMNYSATRLIVEDFKNLGSVAMMKKA